jgi:predicted ribosome quality control (RQC) complex YloA/Tae2 family protein
MLNLSELRRAARLLEDTLDGTRLHRVLQIDNYTLILLWQGVLGKPRVLLSCHPDFARICSVDDVPTGELSASSFHEYLSAHLLGFSCAGLSVSDSNRQASIRLRRADRSFELVLSILGPRSNIYLLDFGRELLHCMRPLEETRRELSLGGPWRDPDGSVRSAGDDRWAGMPDELFLRQVATIYQKLERSRQAAVLARRIENLMAKEEAFLARKAINLLQDLGAARQAEDYRRQGEMLKGVLHTLKLGDDLAIAADYETGERVEIVLDPKLSPAANLESYFARYQKESRGTAIIEQQHHQVMGLLAQLETAREALRETAGQENPDPEALQKLAAQPLLRRLLARHHSSQKAAIPRTKQPAKQDVPGRLLPKRYRTEDGLDIWVGRSDAGNDYLTTRLARGNDLFFHLDGYPGSHVILRTEGKNDAPPRSILDACELAVHFSKMKESYSADVHMAHVKDVKKPRGSKAGLVCVRGGKTIHLRRSSQRLENILASRLDE